MLLRSSRPTVEHASSRRTEMPGCLTRSTSSSRIGLAEFLALSRSSHVVNVGHPIATHTYSVIHYVWWRSSGSLNGSGTGYLRCMTSFEWDTANAANSLQKHAVTSPDATKS